MISKLRTLWSRLAPVGGVTFLNSHQFFAGSPRFKLSVAPRPFFGKIYGLTRYFKSLILGRSHTLSMKMSHCEISWGSRCWEWPFTYRSPHKRSMRSDKSRSLLHPSNRRPRHPMPRSLVGWMKQCMDLPDHIERLGESGR